jgi:hypothetical protein
MSKSELNSNKNQSHSSKHFVSVSEPTQLTEAALPRLREPHHNDTAGDGDLVYVVAWQHGVCQHRAEEREYEALCVLYLTPDGKRAVESWIPAKPNKLERVPRVIRCREGLLCEADVDFTESLTVHPEISD